MKILLKRFCQLFLILTLFILFPAENSYSLIISKNSGSAAYIYIEPQNITDLVNKLNELGKLGYKLKFIERYTEFSPPEDYSKIKIAGVVELHEGDFYEYSWFKSATVPEIEEQFSSLAGKGFYFNSNIGYSLIPEDDTPSVTAEPGTLERDLQSLARSAAIISRLLSQEPIDGNIFILERKNEITNPVEFKLATIKPSKSIFGGSVIAQNKIKEAVEASISEIDTLSFYPVSTFYSSKVFTTRVSHIPIVLFQNNQENNIDVKPDYKVIGGFQLVRSFKKQMELTKEGFNIALVIDKFAVLAAGKKVSYYWLEPEKKDFLQTLANISSNGARYVKKQIGSSLNSNLVFENPLSSL